MKTATQSQTTTTAPTHQTQTQRSDRLDGQFDSIIGLAPQFKSREYLDGYYGSGHVPF